MHTYSIRCMSDEGLQALAIFGPLFLPWYYTVTIMVPHKPYLIKRQVDNTHALLTLWEGSGELRTGNVSEYIVSL